MRSVKVPKVPHISLHTPSEKDGLHILKNIILKPYKEKSPHFNE